MRSAPCLLSMLAIACVLACILILPSPARADSAAWRGESLTPLPPVMAGAWSKFKDRTLNFLANTFDSRERMIQLATIGLCLGLFIIVRAGHINK